jgi:ER membrane protein complex subunit 1
MTTPYLLLSTVAGSIIMIDARLVEPRRPGGREPTEAEKAEGLMQYSPVLPLRHAWFVNHAVPLPRLYYASSSPTEYESTTFITAVGLDHFFARRAPAKEFDQLDPDFNPAFFYVLIAGLAGASLVLKRMVQKKEHEAAWR